MRTMIIAAILVASPAFATKKPDTPPPADVTPVATSDADAAAIAAAEAAAKAAALSAAQANGTQSLTAPVTTELSNAPSYTNRTTAVGLSVDALNPIQPADCFTTGEGYKRAHRILFGAWEVSAAAEWSLLCATFRKESDERKLEILRLQLELEKERNKRVELETRFVEKNGKF